MREEEKKLLNRRENEFFVDIMVLRNTFYKNAEALRGRLKPYRGAWRDLKLMIYLTDKLQAIISETVPLKQLLRYEALAKHGLHAVDIPGPVQLHGLLKICTVESLTAMAEAAMRNECAMCIKDGREIKRCALRKALIEAAPPTEISELGCEYRDAAGALVSGRELSI